MESPKTKLWEEEKFELSLKWIESCQQKKKEYLHECLELIEFDRMSPAFLQHLLETRPIIKNDSKSYKLISGYLQAATLAWVCKEEF